MPDSASWPRLMRDISSRERKAAAHELENWQPTLLEHGTRGPATWPHRPRLSRLPRDHDQLVVIVIALIVGLLDFGHLHRRQTLIHRLDRIIKAELLDYVTPQPEDIYHAQQRDEGYPSPLTQPFTPGQRHISDLPVDSLQAEIPRHQVEQFLL